MALSDSYTLASHTSNLQEELLDPAGRWWTGAELASYSNVWQNLLQSQFEFVWSTATLAQGGDGMWGDIMWGDSIAGGTLGVLTPITNIADNILRLDAVYYTPGGTNTATHRLVPLSLIELESFQRNWRDAGAGMPTSVMYQESADSVSFWPAPASTGTFIFEYPVLCTMSTGTDTQQLPAWTRYGSTAYGAYRALSRFGPNQNLGKAMRYKRLHDESVARYRKIWDAYMPEGGKVLRPGADWAARALAPIARRQPIGGMY